MEILNICLAILAIVVSVIAIIISTLQAKRSDRIALLSLRIEFYNKLTAVFKTYESLNVCHAMINAKNANIVFGPQKPQLVPFVLSRIGKGQIIEGFQQIESDINYLDINKYLFNTDITLDIDIIIDNLTKLSKTLSENLQNNNEQALQSFLEDLSIIFKDKHSINNKIKNIISHKK